MSGEVEKTIPPSATGAINILDQTGINVQAFEQLLDGMRALLYISDPVTDELLYMNPYMREHFSLPSRSGARYCWELMQTGEKGRCSFCPLPRLTEDPGSTQISEEKNSVTGKYYRNTDCFIEWVDGRLVHLNHRVDITEIKTAEMALQRRLAQQELMFSLSQNFISTASMSMLIPNALRMVGEFMNVGKVVLMQANHGTQKLEASKYIWYNENQAVYRPENISMPFLPGTLAYDHFLVGRTPYLAFRDVANTKECAYPAAHGIKSLLDVPIYVDGAYWGSLSFNECSVLREWSPSEIQLARHIGNVISGAVSRHRMEEKLARMSSIVESSPQFVAYVTPEGDFEYVNDSGLYSFWGYTEAELMGAGMQILFEPETYKIVRSEVIPRILSEGKGDFELPMIKKDGDKRIISISAFRTKHTAGGIGIIASDITEKRGLEEKLIWAMERAEESSKAKGEFLSRMSHEMRTPLNAVIGMTSIARSAKDLEKKEYCLEKIEEASVHLLGVINDILDMSKIEAKKFELSYTDFCFEEMLKRIINVITFRSDEKKQNLIVNLDENLRHSIVSDEQRLAQVITNLLSNAVKFTPEGGTISLRVQKLEEVEGRCTLQVEVTDTGIGMTPEQQRRLFQSFEQADGSISRQFGGTGLGLAISKSIVEMMGGTIWTESVYGKGSTFAFTIKAERGTNTLSPGLSPTVDWQSLRVLVVDDSPEVLAYFQHFAETVPFSCEVAGSAEEACRILAEQGAAAFHIVFVDWHMPGMDSAELTQRIKKTYAGDTIVTMISAYQWSDIGEAAQKAGADRFLPKPLFHSQIVDCVNECLGTLPIQEEECKAGGSEEGCFAGHRILLVEDIEVNREIIISLLEHTGLEIDCAENGRIAYDMFRDAPERYALIFMDIHMPEMDGYEATWLIRALDTPLAQSIPIVAMTANVFREDIERCLDAGMNDHISKPVNVEEIFSKLQKLLKGYRAGTL